jgi:Spy/CpxP family protein refolding chaperone
MELMKFTKTSLIIMAVAGVLALSSSSQAQTNTPPGGRQGQGGGGARGRGAEQQLQQFSEQLKLTDAQKPKVKAALEEQVKKLQDLRADTTLSQQDRRTKMQTIRDDFGKQMKEILTADQYKKFEEIQQQNRGRRQGGAGGGAAGGGQNRAAAGNNQ